MSVKDTLKVLCQTFGPTGRETAIAAKISEMVAPYVDEVYTDAMGNVIAVKHGGEDKLMLAAHMDEIGFIVTHIDENGFLRFAAMGGVRPANAQFRQVEFENGTRGVIGCEQRTVENAGQITMDKLFIDIGADSAEEAAKKVSIGDIGCFISDFVDMGNRMSSAAMDDRAGCAVVIEALKGLKKPAMDIYAVFTTQEEVGSRGAKTAAFDLEPDVSIALDVSPAGDTPECAPNITHLGRGAAIKIKDQTVICNPVVVNWLERVAAQAGIPTQREILAAGGTDAGVIQLSRSGAVSGVLSIPCRYVHSQGEVVDIRDIQADIDLLIAAMQQGF